MRGVILAGGLGTRMGMFTRRCGNKHVMQVYNRPMIEYPMSTLSQAGVDELAIVTSNHHAGDLCKLIGNGHEFGFKSVQYFVQIGEGGIADALKLVRPFVGQEKFIVILGDNILQADISSSLKRFETDYNTRCGIFTKEVLDPHRFGVAEFDENNKVIGIEEKPKFPKSNHAIIGVYLLDPYAFSICDELIPSDRGELEITDVLESYMQRGELGAYPIDGFWSDAGTIESCYKTSQWIKENHDKLVESGRFAKYQFRLAGGIFGDYLADL